jgi:hypothetical protein
MDKFGELLVFPLIYAGLQNTKSHWLLNDIVVVGDITFVDAAMEQSRRIMATAAHYVSRAVYSFHN